MAQLLVQSPDERAFVATFVREFVLDLREHPLPQVITAKLAQQHAVARLMRTTLKLVREAGATGIQPAALRAAYEALEVQTRVRELIERKLTVDGVVRIVGDRMVFSGTAATWRRLAEMRA